MFNYKRELERLLEKYPDPRLGGLGLHYDNQRQMRKAVPPRFGVVADNKDPLCLGRLRVACDMIVPGAVTDWIPLVSPGAGKDRGWWQLPDIGTQVLLGFVGSINRPVVLGCVYDLKHRPPKHSTEKPADSIVCQTKSHRLEIIDEEGKETIIISTAKGKMRYTMTSGKGIELINELGDIRIKCRKLRIAGEGAVQIQAKKVSMASEGDATIKAKKHIKLECDKEVQIKGQNIKLNASRGITTGGKQLAAQGDKVMGFDIHQMVAPSGSGTAVVPLPHPYIGKLADKLSDNVKINGHNAATKGSVSKHDHPVHNQLPGTIRFNKSPNKEGEVTGGTAAKVKINGKEAAVAGSTVTTCNDTGARDNSTILAAGASMPMPVIINPKNMAEHERERAEQEQRRPEFTAARWGKSAVQEGEAVELTAQVKDIADGNMVTFQVWKEGQDPASHTSYHRILANLEGGVAKGKWAYRPVDVGDELPPETDPKFFFTVHSAWCPPWRSGMLAVELKRPELSGPEWQDKEGNSADKGLVGEPLKLAVSCNEDMDEGAGVTFRVYPDGADPKRDKPVYEAGSQNEGGKAEAEWKPVETREAGDTSELKYFFTAVARRAKLMQSDAMAVKNPQMLEMKWEPQSIYYGDDVTLSIKSMEVAEFGPEITVVMELSQKDGSVLIVQEENIKIDKDDIEKTIPLNFSSEVIDLLKNNLSIDLHTRLENKSAFYLKPCGCTPLWVGFRLISGGGVI